MHVCLGKSAAFIDCMLAKVYWKGYICACILGSVYSKDKSIDPFLASVPKLHNSSTGTHSLVPITFFQELYMVRQVSFTTHS